MPSLSLRVTPDPLAVARLAPDAELPAWALRGSFSSVSRTPAELSIVCDDDAVPAGVTVEHGWRALVVDGPMAFTLTGILAAALAPLAEAGIGIFALSTYDTDWILVPGPKLDAAVTALRAAGHAVSAS